MRPFRRPVAKDASKEVFRTNEDIKVASVRLIDGAGTMVGVVSIGDALKMAQDAGLDLVEISSQSTPPVCKIVDYGRFLYQREKKKKEAKKNQRTVTTKEIKMRPKTDVHDYDFKVRRVRFFLGNGDKVKVTIRFKGREMSFTDLGRRQIERVIEDTKDLAKVESLPKMEGRTMFMVLSPTKKVEKVENAGDAKSAPEPKIEKED